MTLCSACPVLRGECPRCHTFWINRDDGKRYGVRPVDANPWPGGDTTYPAFLNHLTNVVER